MKIVIIDYGMGNLRSVIKAFKRIGHDDIVISGDPKVVESADKVILPGVGHFKLGMSNLKSLGIYEVLYDLVINKKKWILGICLGMQLFTKFSEEGETEGFGWVDANTIHFSKLLNNNSFRVPHIGWNSLKIRKQSQILKNINSSKLFYFVHSYAVLCNKDDDILLETNYGINFHSGFQHENIIGLQFHPEKSHNQGLELLNNFLEL